MIALINIYVVRNIYALKQWFDYIMKNIRKHIDDPTVDRWLGIPSLDFELYHNILKQYVCILFISHSMGVLVRLC